jgi:chemotaxis protein methyltransferase WspC
MNIAPGIRRFLAASLRMDENAAGKGAVSRAIAEAMRQEGISDPQTYEQLFASSPDVRQRLINAVVIGETWFFRDRGPFTGLARHAQELRNEQAGNVLTILSAPCATGEEPYSIVMSLLAAGLPPASFSVDGVDVSTRALDKARRACYGSSSFRGNIGEDFVRFFEITPHGRQVTQQVVRQVTFHLDNLVLPGSLAGRGPYAVIFCRNLLIYLTTEARRQVFLRLDGLLLPGGLLFSGHTETIFWHQQGYLPLKWDRAFALTKPALPLSSRTTTTAKTLKMPTLTGARRKEIKIPTGRAPESHEKTFMAPSLASVESEQPVKPLQTDAGPIKPFIDEQLQEARRLADQGDMDGAVRLCEEYARKVGPAAETYCLMGIISMARQDMSHAEDYFLKALYLDPGHYESLVHTSLIYREKGDDRKAALYRERAERKADMQGKNMEVSKTSSTKEKKNGKLRTN